MPAQADETTPRKVQVAPSVEVRLTEARQQFPRFQQVYDGLLWILARNPERGSAFTTVTTQGGREVRTTRHILATRSKDDDVPDIVLSYTFDDSTLTIRGLRCHPAGGMNVF